MAEPLRSAKIMTDKILADKNLLSQLQTDPEKVLRETAEQVPVTFPPPPSFRTLSHIELS